MLLTPHTNKSPSVGIFFFQRKSRENERKYINIVYGRSTEIVKFPHDRRRRPRCEVHPSSRGPQHRRPTVPRRATAEVAGTDNHIGSTKHHTHRPVEITDGRFFRTHQSEREDINQVREWLRAECQNTDSYHLYFFHISIFFLVENRFFF